MVLLFKAGANMKKFQKEQAKKNLDGRKLHVLPYTRHIRQEYPDLVEQIRKTERGKDVYARCKETIERVFAPIYERTTVFAA